MWDAVSLHLDRARPVPDAATKMDGGYGARTTCRSCRSGRVAVVGRLRRFGRGPVNVGFWHVRDVTPAATRAQPSRVERPFQRAARSCFVQDVVDSEHFRVVTPKCFKRRSRQWPFLDVDAWRFGRRRAQPLPYSGSDSHLQNCRPQKFYQC
jgi:hypothetical protein